MNNIGTPPRNLPLEDPAFIKRAVTSHQALLQVVQNLYRYLKLNPPPNPLITPAPEWIEFEKSCYEALKLAGEEV